MPGLGYTSFLGYVAETTWGTRVTPTTKFLAMTPRGDGLKGESLLLRATGINEVSTHRTRKVFQGQRKAGGTVAFEVPYEGAELLFRYAFGKSVTTGANPYTHVFTISPADWLALVGLTLETKADYLPANDAGYAASLASFFYEGCLISGIEFSVSRNGFLVCTLDVAGEDETQTTSSTVSLLNVPLASFFDDGSGSGVYWNAGAAVVTDFRVKLELGLDTERFVIGSKTPKKPLMGGPIKVSGSFRAEYDSVGMWDDFRVATVRNLYLRLVGNVTNRDIKIEIPVAIIGPTAKAVVDNEGIVYAEVPFDGFWDGTDREMKMTLVNTVASF